MRRPHRQHLPAAPPTIVRGKANAKVEFGAKVGASIVNSFTYVDNLCWDAYNESSDLATQLELYKKRYGMLPQEVQADKLYLGKVNRNLIKDCHVGCYNHPLGRPPKEENNGHAENKKMAIGETETRWRPHSEPQKGFTGQTTSGRNLTTRLAQG
ncbi:hypothetical protein [Hallella sp.]|uniref:hypothetical protein n=1 Tax=Hallella sp. TaxID=2980186 RepID=UPI0030804E5E